MRVPSSRKAVAGAVTIAVLFLVVVVAGLLIFSYFTGFLGLGVQTAGHVTASGTLQPDSSGVTGVILVTVSNTGTTPVTSVTFTCAGSEFTSATCGGLAALYNGLPVSAQNALPQKNVATGSSKVQAAIGTTFSYGTLYTISCTATFSNGSSQTLTIPLAQG